MGHMGLHLALSRLGRFYFLIDFLVETTTINSPNYSSGNTGVSDVAVRCRMMPYDGVLISPLWTDGYMVSAPCSTEQPRG